MDHSSLLKWNSCQELLDPPENSASRVKRIHIYDFDNTLYNSPHPNRELYAKPLLNQLTNGSLIENKNWWGEPDVLRQSFNDMLQSDNAEKNAYWNADMLNSTQLSYLDPETVSIVLTGRKERSFSKIFSEMLTCYGTLHFNACCLRKESVGSSTNEYKIHVIKDLLDNYAESLEEIKIYDDRLGQVRQFESFFCNLQPAFKWEIVHVSPRFKPLKPSDELRIIQSAYSEAGRDLGISLGWTPRQYGYFLARHSYKSLLNLTFHFLQKKYKMSSLPYYPLLIPCIEAGEQMPELELMKILSNNDNEVVQSSSKSGDILKNFEDLPVLKGSCVFQFDVTQIGLKKRGDGVCVFYRAKPSNHKRYMWTKFQDWIVTIDDRLDKKDPLQAVPFGELCQNQSQAQSFEWVRLRNPLKIKTYFGQHSRLTLTKS